ncbi:hypothetical protein [Novosphingobium sp. MD-1]|uniref:hypothetical protein n=1 Tax=Novosphingobium sp. MD-1 TaxID=1630648 RepID=UPI000F7DFE95|nr:hypothetical protein [Novosphingobium sp. MD-1]
MMRKSGLGAVRPDRNRGLRLFAAGLLAEDVSGVAANRRPARSGPRTGVMGLAALALASCVSSPDQLRDQTVWVYSPYHGGQSTMIPVNVPGAASRSSAIAAQGDRQAMSQNQIKTGPLLADLELPQIAEIIIQHLADRTQSGLSTAWLLSVITGNDVPPGTASGTSFPSRVIVRNHSCRAPNAGIEKFATEHLCYNGVDRYEEVVIQDFSHWNILTDLKCRDCVAEFVARQRQFTLESLTTNLMTSGYNSVGVVQKQQFEHGFPSPFVYNGFVRDGGPLIAAGHTPQRTNTEGEQTSSVRELRLFLPTRG